MSGSVLMAYPAAHFVAAEAGPFCLPESASERISAIAKQVGAPEYVRTPQFARRVRGGGRRRPAADADCAWAGMRQFQPTKLQRPEGTQARIAQVRKYLNKISEATFTSLKGKLLETIALVGDDSLAQKEIAAALFGIASSNGFYSLMYARLYKDLVEAFPAARAALTEQFAKGVEAFLPVRSADPVSQYELFCEVNRENDVRRATARFYVNLVGQGILDASGVVQLALEVQRHADEALGAPTAQPLMDEASELMHIFVVGGVARSAALRGGAA